MGTLGPIQRLQLVARLALDRPETLSDERVSPAPHEYHKSYRGYGDIYGNVAGGQTRRARTTPTRALCNEDIPVIASS